MVNWHWRLVMAAIPTLLCTSIFAAPRLDLSRDQDNSTQPIEVQQLVAGIGYNIMAQNGEVAAASAMQNILTVPTPSPMLFQAAKDDLLSFMASGMRIRGNNMKLSGINPQITRGLAKLEETQVLQMATANNLTGIAEDGATLVKLQSLVQVAINRNQMLQALATGGSGIATMMTKPVLAPPSATDVPSD